MQYKILIVKYNYKYILFIIYYSENNGINYNKLYQLIFEFNIFKFKYVVSVIRYIAIACYLFCSKVNGNKLQYQVNMKKYFIPKLINYNTIYKNKLTKSRLLSIFY